MLNDKRLAGLNTDWKILSRGNEILLSMKDIGIGIPKGEIPMIFEEFHRADNAKAVKRDGTGLGLSLVKQIVEGYNGKIWVESIEGQGAILILFYQNKKERKIVKSKKIIFWILTSLILALILGKDIVYSETRNTDREAIGAVFAQAADFKLMTKEKEYYYLVSDKNKKEIGIALVTSAVGRNGIIKIMVGITWEGKVSGIKILSHQETAGVGSKITEPVFYQQFSGKSAQEIRLKKDGGIIDAVTSATVSSTAVSEAVEEALKKAKILLQNIKKKDKKLKKSLTK